MLTPQDFIAKWRRRRSRGRDKNIRVARELREYHQRRNATT